MMKRFRQPRGNDSLLEQAIAAWREAPGEQALRPETRDRILGEALAGGDAPPSFAALFTPTRHWVLAAIAPAALTLVAALLLGVTNLGIQEPAVDAGPRLEVSKVGDEVVFLIANGKPTHTVYKSTQPDHFDASSAVVVKDGQYRDRATGGPDIVFYRID